MPKTLPHPKALLSTKRNVRRGVLARSKILEIIERDPLNAKKIAEKTGLSYSNVMHHLRLLEAERIVTHGKTKPYTWRLTGIGQVRLVDLIGV